MNNDNITKNLPTTVLGWRQRFGLSQRQFAKKTGVKLETLRSWEQGRRNPPDYFFKYLELIEIVEAMKFNKLRKAECG